MGKPTGLWSELYKLPDEWDCWNCGAINSTPDPRGRLPTDLVGLPPPSGPGGAYGYGLIVSWAAPGAGARRRTGRQ